MDDYIANNVREYESFKTVLRKKLSKAKSFKTVVEKFQAYETDPAAMPRLRYLHDKYGWKAKGTAELGGLCVGAIYRTVNFMAISPAQRDGSKGRDSRGYPVKNIHIEHTVPVRMLKFGLAYYRDPAIRTDGYPTAPELFRWTMRHSICTAMSFEEECLLREHCCSAGSPCFRAKTGAPQSQKPFERYLRHSINLEIWNMVTGKRIDLSTWTFDDHEKTLKKAGVYDWPA